MTRGRHHRASHRRGYLLLQIRFCPIINLTMRESYTQGSFEKDRARIKIILYEMGLSIFKWFHLPINFRVEKSRLYYV